MKIKELRMYENQKKREQEQLQIQSEKKKIAKMKSDKIKEIENKKEEARLNERESMRKRYEDK